MCCANMRCWPTGERGALIGPRGDISWMCAPRWDDDAVFSALIGGRGVFALTPSERFVWGGHYEDGSLIWRSRWVTVDGIIECREALAFPGDAHRVVLMRRLMAVRGDARAELVFAPAAGFGRHGMTHLARDDHGCWHAWTGPLRVRLHGAEHATPPATPAASLAARRTQSARGSRPRHRRGTVRRPALNATTGRGIAMVRHREHLANSRSGDE